MKLSKENYDKIIKTGLYRNNKIKTDGWCRNETYYPHFYEQDGEIYMFDSYWDSWEYGRYELTDDNFNDWELIIDFNDYNERQKWSPCEEYNKEDYIKLATNSGGWSYPYYYLKKDAEKNIDYLIRNCKNEIDNAKKTVERKEKELKKLLEKKQNNEM
jgi:hypothetical protein